MSLKHSIYRRRAGGVEIPILNLKRLEKSFSLAAVTMDSSRLALLFFFIPLQLASLNFVHSEKLAQLCLVNSNFTVNSTYGNNLKNLFSTITSDTQVDHGFYNFSNGRNSDKVNAIGLCRGDLMPDSCRSCIKNTTDEFTEHCPTQREGFVWYDDCMLRYSNRSIFGKMEFEPGVSLLNVNNVSNVNQFNQALATLLDGLRTQAASGDSLRKFAAGNASASNSQTIYGMAQCTPDLSRVDCNNCLSKATESLSQCCSGKKGARVLTPSCNIRYENYIFYSPLVNTPPAALSPASPPVDAPPPPAPLTQAPPPQQPNLATRKGDMNSRFQVLATVVPLMILQYFVF